MRFTAACRQVTVTGHCCSESSRLLMCPYELPEPRQDRPPARAGRGFAAAESPAGLLYVRLDLLSDGTIGAARLIGPWELNLAAIDLDVRRAARTALHEHQDANAAKLSALREDVAANYGSDVAEQFPVLEPSRT